MKVKPTKKLGRKRSKSFLVLDEKTSISAKMPNNTGLKLFTKTWTKKKSKEEKIQRPLTATLEKPAILDINLISSIDMSTIRKEFLNISSLYRIPLTISIGGKRNKTAVINRPLSLPSPEKVKNKKPKRPETSEDTWDDNSELKSISRLEKMKISRNNNNVKKSGDLTDKQVNKPAVLSINDDNNNKTIRIPRKRVVGKLANITNDVGEQTNLPEPCRACGRPDQPERFHSHPNTPLKPVKKQEKPIKMKNSVQKPIAIKYKSKQTSENKPTPPRKSSLPCQKLVHTPPNISGTVTDSEITSPGPVIKSGGKRTLTCYICGREFGTASLPLHEPKCLQKLERENANLPAHLQRKIPKKPTSDSDSFSSFESTLIPCENCGRTFMPDRLIVHQRSCKGDNAKVKRSPRSSEIPRWTGVDTGSPDKALEAIIKDENIADAFIPECWQTHLNQLIPCKTCKRTFNPDRVEIHERSCKG